MKVYLYVCGGFSDLSVQVFPTFKAASDAMKNDFYGMAESLIEVYPEDIYILEDSATVFVPGEMEAEDAWGARIIEKEIELSEESPDKSADASQRVKNFAIERESGYGTDILTVFSAPDWDTAVDYAIAYCVPALKAAYDNGEISLDDLFDNVAICPQDTADGYVARGLDPENCSGFYEQGCYISLKELMPNRCKAAPAPPLTEEEKKYVKIVREGEDPAYDLIKSF